MLRKSAATALVLAAAAAAACSNPWRGYAPTYQEIVGGGWIGPEVAAAPAPLFCYATLAEPDCFRWPQPGQEGRLVGFYGALPR